MKTLIKNKLGNKTNSFSLPAVALTAQTFCADFLDGEYAGYSLVGTSGSDVVAGGYNQVSVMIRNTAGLSTYLNLACKASKSEADIYTVLNGLTFNGVKADEIAITKMVAVA